MTRILAIALSFGLLAGACRHRDQPPPAAPSVSANVDSIRVPSSDPDDPIDPATGVAESCDFDTTFAHPEAEPLLREFVARAATGQFAHGEDWLPRAVDCIGHEPGYDTFLIASNYSLSRLDSMADTFRYTLSRSVLGFSSSGEPFTLQRRVVADTVTLHRTKFGWRIKSPAPWNWITMKNALDRGWLHAADTAAAATAH